MQGNEKLKKRQMLSAQIDLSKFNKGAFFEDINYGADGGLYAELIKNRSFEFP